MSHGGASQAAKPRKPRSRNRRMESHAKYVPQATQRLGNALRVRGAVWALSNQASTLLRTQPRVIALALLLIGATGTSIVILTDTLRRRGGCEWWP